MRILVTGVGGQLGYDVIQELTRREMECKGVDLEDFDISNEEDTKSFILSYRPDAVIHCSAYTAVDKAEDNRELCSAINAKGSKNIAKACREIDATMLYVSTDYVFPGAGESFFETDDATGPLNVYGQTKLDGELAVKETLDKYFIVRTSWVFGENGNNFIKAMLKLSETRDEINVVSDQIGSPTYTTDLAVLLCDMIVTDQYGAYHATNEGVCSWAEFAEEVFRIAERNIKINYITTEAYPTRAVRPKNSRLSKKSLDESGFKRLPEWQDAVERYLVSLNMDM